MLVTNAIPASGQLKWHSQNCSAADKMFKPPLPHTGLRAEKIAECDGIH